MQTIDLAASKNQDELAYLCLENSILTLNDCAEAGEGKFTYTASAFDVSDKDQFFAIGDTAGFLHICEVGTLKEL